MSAHRTTRAALMVGCMAVATAAAAQTAATDVVVMRIKLSPPKANPTPTPTPAPGLINGSFNATGGGWTSEAGFTIVPDGSNSVGKLDSPTINSPAGVRQSFAVVKGHSYTFSYKTYLLDGSYCAVPFVAYFADGNTRLAQDSFTHCGGPVYNRSFSWTADRTKTISVGFSVTAQSSNRTYPAVDDAKVVDNSN
jgi:hypothetical protein